MDLLHVSGIHKQEAGNTVLQEIGFRQQAGQKIAIVGESGAGKSTLLKIIAGLVQPDAGQVLLEGKRVEGPYEKLIPGHPAIAYLSQHFELRNNYRVEEILSYANELPGDEAGILYEVCRIDHLLQRKTDQLSGGEKQRIALARLLVGAPRLLLLDEPYSNLDLPHKKLLKSIISDIGERLHITCLLVSHDPQDILPWADEIIVMKQGRFGQQGSPEHIYRQPADEYTGALFGDYCLMSPADTLTLSGLPEAELPGKRLFIRPEQWVLGASRNNAIEGRVGKIAFAGAGYEIDIFLPRYTIRVKTTATVAVAVAKGDTVYVSCAPGDRWYV